MAEESETGVDAELSAGNSTVRAAPASSTRSDSDGGSCSEASHPLATMARPMKCIWARANSRRAPVSSKR